jgi:hypothetical protein
MKITLMPAALLALGALSFTGCATSGQEHAGKACDGSCCKDAAARAKFCTNAVGCVKWCKK